MNAPIAFFVLALLAASSAAASDFDILKGSAESLRRQNDEADRENLSRLEENDLEFFIKTGWLVPLPENYNMIVDSRLAERYRWCRPWTRDFLLNLGAAYGETFSNPIQINSAVRTVQSQIALRRVNANAAPAKDGEFQSTHLTGSAVDIAKKGMYPEQIDWMRRRLAALQKMHLIIVEEEFYQQVFHIMVLKRYGPWLNKLKKRAAF